MRATAIWLDYPFMTYLIMTNYMQVNTRASIIVFLNSLDHISLGKGGLPF